MFNFILNFFKRKVKLKEPTFDFIIKIKTTPDYIFSNLEYNYDIINYLANRFKIPLENIFIQNINNSGVHCKRYKSIKSKYVFSKQYVFSDKFPNEFIIIPEPNTPYSLFVAIHEMVHYYKKHSGKPFSLQHEYEAERLSLSIMRKLKLGYRSNEIYDELLVASFINNIKLYTNDKYIQFDYIHKYMKTLK